MRLEKVALADTHSFSGFFLDYLAQKDSLRPFYNRFPELNSFGDQIKEKSSFPKEYRQVLVDTLEHQYKEYTLTTKVKDNIKSLLSEKTFTVTTGHQLNLFTGPLYFIYKIVTVINTCERLKVAYPKQDFVPVYWMASEDHDFAEICYFHLYGKKYTWESDQRGAVGRFNLKGLESLLKEVPGNVSFFRNAYLKHKTLSDAVRFYVNELFGESGLVVLDADNRNLKALAKDVLQDDLFSNTAKQLVEQSTQELESLGYKTQVHAREINLFYLDNTVRSRIEKINDEFQVVDTPLSFTQIELEKKLDKEPEIFSPNVILRPLYQELILPNLAYIGGPAEVIYWLQLKRVFDHYKVPFPMLMPRNFAMVMESPLYRKFEKTGLDLKDLFGERHQLFNNWVVKNSTHSLSLENSVSAAESIYDKLTSRATTIDSTLGPLVSAELQRLKKGLEKIESKMIRAERRLHSDKLRQIGTLKDALFPGGGLQERHDNFLTFYLQDTSFIKKLYDAFDPFDFRFNTLIYDEEGGTSKNIPG